mgnify:CR=1 FL=1
MTAISKPMIEVLLRLSAGPQSPTIARTVATLRVLERRGYIARIGSNHIRMTRTGRGALDKADPKRVRQVQDAMRC